jgi:hypothetical protein
MQNKFDLIEGMRGTLWDIAVPILPPRSELLGI